jgi:hypothetical protein
MVFEGCFKNTNEGQMESRFSNEVGHRFWLQDSFNHLNKEWKASYIAAVLHQILEFLHI